MSPMPSTVSSEQQRFFRQNDYIEFEDLVSHADLQRLFEAIQKTLQDCPGLKADRLARSIPFLLLMVRRKNLGAIAYQLIEKKPLRLGHEQFFSSKPSLSYPLETDTCGLLLYLTGEEKKGNGIFFRNALPEKILYHSPDACYLFLAFTPKRLSDELNPIIYP